VNCASSYNPTEGQMLVDACIWCKTDYVDISQEIDWTLHLKQLHRAAADAEVVVVPGCASNAYSDLGVFLLAKKIRNDFGEATRSAVCYCSGGGADVGACGGTMRSCTTTSFDRERMTRMADPYSLGGFIPETWPLACPLRAFFLRHTRSPPLEHAAG